MSLRAYTVMHVVLSLVGIGSGCVMTFGLFTGKRADRVLTAICTGAAVRSGAVRGTHRRCGDQVPQRTGRNCLVCRIILPPCGHTVAGLSPQRSLAPA